MSFPGLSVRRSHATIDQEGNTRVTVRFAVSIPQLVTDSTLHHEADAGAGLIVLNPRFDDHEQMERLSADVIPQVS